MATVNKPNTRYHDYYRLTKPGIIYGNIFMLLGGYVYGSQGHLDPATLLGATIGTALIIACGCVINNYLDRHIDASMKRTSNRALVTGRINKITALIYAAGLGLAGFLTLALTTNALTVWLGIAGLFSYAIIYTFAKRYTVHGTLIGTFPGALPPVAGYTAATGKLDTTALILFIIMVCWQMVHFYAIAIYRRQDYSQAKIPTMLAIHGFRNTAIQMIFYGLGFAISLVALWAYSYAGIVFILVMLPLSVWWVYDVMLGLRTPKERAWAQSVFKRSLLLLPSTSAMLALSVWLP